MKTANTVASMAAITILNIETAIFAGFFFRSCPVLAAVSALFCVYALASRDRIRKDARRGY